MNAADMIAALDAIEADAYSIEKLLMGGPENAVMGEHYDDVRMSFRTARDIAAIFRSLEQKSLEFRAALNSIGDGSAPKAAHRVLDLPMGDNDAQAERVRDYLKALLRGVIDKQEGFNGKRPFGNSGWIGELEKPLVQGGIVPGSIDEEGYPYGVDSKAAKAAIISAINDL